MNKVGIARTSKGANCQDGIFGQETEAKVKAWQTQNGLVADGIMNNATWTRLFPASVDDRWISLKGVFPMK